MNHKKWKVLTQTDVSPSKWFPVIKEEVELPSGKVIEYFKSQLASVAMVVAVTREKEVVFVRQYKHGIGEVCLEFPAGRIEEGKTARETAAAELQEETGIMVGADQFTELIELWTEPSKSTVRVKGFLVTDVEISEVQNLEETEMIEAVKIPVTQLDELFASGELHASDTVALLLYAREKFSQYFK